MKKEIARMEMPDWFAKDVTDGVNTMMKALEIPYILENRLDATLDKFKSFLTMKVPAIQGKLLASYMHNLMECAWDKLRLMHPSMCEADSLHSDFEQGVIIAYMKEKDDKPEGLEGLIDFMRRMKNDD